MLKCPSMLLGGRIDFVQVKKKQTTEFSNKNQKKYMGKDRTMQVLPANSQDIILLSKG